MENYIFFNHYILARQNVVKGVLCVDKDHDLLRPSYDYEKNKMRLRCPYCDYTITPGLKLYEKMSAEVKQHIDFLLENKRF